MAQILSAALGGTVNHALGKPAVAGASVAQYGTKWNEELEDLINQLPSSEKEKIEKMVAQGAEIRAIRYLTQYTIDHYPEMVKIAPGAFEGVRFLGKRNAAYTVASGMYGLIKYKYDTRPITEKEYAEWLEMHRGDA